MKTLLALTVLTLICFLKHSSAIPVGVNMVINNDNNMVINGCCKAVTNKIHIPVIKVTNVTMTSGCSPEAIIVTTLKRSFCLDPEWKHAQMHLEEFKKRSAPTTLEPETTKEMKKNFSSNTLKPETTKEMKKNFSSNTLKPETTKEMKKNFSSNTLKPETTKEMKKNFSSTTLKPTTT